MPDARRSGSITKDYLTRDSGDDTRSLFGKSTDFQVVTDDLKSLAFDQLDREASSVKKPCVFCTLPRVRIVAENEFAVVVRDGFPVSPGHTLIIPRRHIGSFFELSEDERNAMLALLDSTRTGLESEFHPDGYNIGINDGPAAGQTVAHLHIHLIPRYVADSADPRGGVRWVLPKKAKYWE